MFWDKDPKYWNAFMNELIKQASEILKSGPTAETPFFRQLKSQIDEQVRRNQETALKEAMKSGAWGGPYSKIASDIYESGFKAKTGGLTDYMSQALGLGLKTAGMKQQEELEKMKMMLEAYLAKKARKSQEDIAKMGQISQSTMSGISSCCFIFIEGEGELTESVRKFRDQHFKPDGYVANGYRKMSRWLVPMMKRIPFIKKIIQWILTKPLSYCAKHYGTWGSLFLSPIGFFWVGVWYLYGRISIPQRPFLPRFVN